MIECPVAIEWVALASIASSTTIAGGSLYVTLKGQRDQRKHDARQAFEERAWEEKSKTLYNAIMWSRGLARTMRGDSQAQQVESIHFVSEYLPNLVGSIEAYASDGCREAFTALERALDAVQLDHLTRWRITAIREEKEEAIGVQDFDAAARARQREKELLDRLVSSLDYDADHIATLAEKLVVEARKSVQSQDS